MPIIITPIHSINDNKTISCFEVINKKGLIGRSLYNKSNIDSVQGEMLEHFISQFSVALSKALIHDKYHNRKKYKKSFIFKFKFLI